MAKVFTNSFENGMNKDFSPLLQPQGTYTNMINCTLITQDGNNYTVKDCIGNLLTFAINTPYSISHTVFEVAAIPLAMISFPNRLIVLSTNNEDANTVGYLEIGEIKYLPYGEGIQPLSVSGQLHNGYTPLYHSAFLNGNKMYRIEGIAMPEGEQTERIYWTDNNEQPRVFNTADPKYTTYIASGSLSPVNGTKYMVLEGAVTYDGDSLDYGPGMPNGNIITITGSVVTYTNLTGGSPTPKIIEYVDYALLDWTPQRHLGNMTFDGYGSGVVNCGNKIYFFRYGLSTDGYFTPWSYPSSPVNVNVPNESEFLLANPYADTVGAGTASITFQSSYSVKIRVDDIDTKYDIIQLAVVEFNNLTDVISNAAIVAQESVSITDTEIVLTHTGDTSLGSLTIEDLTLFPASIEKVKTLDTNKNYLLIGNITEREELNVDYITNGVTLSDFQYELPSYATVGDLTTFEIPSIGATGGVNPAAGSIVPESHWFVLELAGGTVEYPVGSGTFYTDGEDFVGLDTYDTVTITGSAQVRPCIVKNRYDSRAAVSTKEVIEMKNSDNFWDYKDPLVHQQLTGYWSGEKYRFGILFYDLKGNPYYVRWIGDYTFTSAIDKGGVTKSHQYQTADFDFICLNPSGLNVQNLKIPQSEVAKISGFSIVRAPRDARVITQGLVTQCTYTAGAPNEVRAGAYIPISYDVSGATLQQKAYVYISPDLLCQSSLKGTVGVVGDTMEGACWLDCAGLPLLVADSIVNDEQLISKILYSQTGDSASDRTSTITKWRDVAEAQDANLDGTTIFGSYSQTAAVTPTLLVSAVMSHGKLSYFELENDFNQYLLATGYTANANNGTTFKILMNYVKTNFDSNNAYGGTGDFALSQTQYISTGHYQAMDAALIAATCDTGNVNSYNELIIDNIEVWGGDCYVNMIDYGL